MSTATAKNDSDSARLDKLEEWVRHKEDLLFSTNPASPGLALRMDRLERTLNAIRWISTTGLLGLAGTLVMLWKIAELLAKAG